MLTQTWAMLVDAYRELCARKLFWISLGLSGLVVAVFAMLGLNEQGIAVLWWTIPLDEFNSTLMNKTTFYKLVFQGLGVGIWLTWVAAILALISTAGFFPSLMESGAIEVHLSKPIGRWRIFLTRYFTGLLFVALQVGVFTLMSFVVLGARGGLWEPRLFLAIPIVITFFSYIYCVSVLIGVMTRSAIAAILLTILFWFVLYILNTTDTVLLGFTGGRERVVEARAARIERMERNTREQLIEAKKAEVGEEAAAGYTPTDEELVATMPFITRERDAQVADESALESLQFWSGMIFKVKTVLPKTAETTQLLDRWLIAPEETANLQQRAEADQQEREEEHGGPAMSQEAIVEKLRDRPVWWIVGTSLGFEAVVLALAGFVFVRRDY